MPVFCKIAIILQEGTYNMIRSIGLTQ